MKWALALIFCISFACLAYRAGHTANAADWIDPVSRIDAQDEALYSHSAIRIAQIGDWLTPMFMGRYGLYKPPLLMWLSAGISDPVQTSGENQALFYLKRLFLTDSVLCAAALAALPWLLGRMRRNHYGAAALLAAWLLATFASVLLWRYRHAPYLLTGDAPRHEKLDWPWRLSIVEGGYHDS